MAKLVFIGEQWGGRVYEFALERTTVGRSDHNTLTIHDPSVSQTHCEILVYGTEVIVRDLGSSNGTFVDGERLQNQQRQLKAGRTVKFGAVEARLELEESSSPDSASDITALHSFARHRQERQERQPSPKLEGLVLDDGAGIPPAEQTRMIHRPQARPNPLVPPLAEALGPPASARSPGLFKWIILALVVGLAVVLWLVFGRH